MNNTLQCSKIKLKLKDLNQQLARDLSKDLNQQQLLKDLNKQQLSKDLNQKQSPKKKIKIKLKIFFIKIYKNLVNKNLILVYYF